MSDSPTPARPCTAYNLFFRIEREYILQAHLGHPPAVPPGAEAYDPSTLPRRYRALVLPRDWHVSSRSRERRRKRSHRRAHGKIGFRELNERISAAWNAAGDDVRDFCGRLSDAEWIAYRRVKGKAKAKRRRGESKGKGKTRRVASEAEEKVGEEPEEGGRAPFASFDWKVNFTDLMHADCDADDPPLGRIVSDNISEEDTLDLSQSNAAPRVSVTEVDMGDEEIIDLWRTTRTEDEREVPAGDRREVPSSPPTTEPRAGTAKRRRRTDEDAARSSFVDAEYERFKELGRWLVRQRGALAPRGRTSVNACQA